MLFQSNGLPPLGSYDIEPTRMGNEFGFATPANVFECADGPIYIGVLLDAHWQIFAPIIGEPDLADHESFATREERSANRDVCNMMVSSWTADKKRTDVINILRNAGLPAAPVNSFVDAAKDEHVLARDMLQPTELANGVTAPITGPAAKFSRTPTKVRIGAPELGQHSEEVLRELDLSDKDVEKLRTNGVIG